MTETSTKQKSVTILGAGPAGLAAAHESLALGLTPQVFEMSGTVGGISRTDSYKGYLIDIGGHRFFTRMDNISHLWQEMMRDDFLTVSRKSRIYYCDNFFDYPFKIVNVLKNLGLIESFRILLSYLLVQLRPIPKEDTFEQWVINRFGRRLFVTFFKTYTEKVWGIPCSEIQADWAAQRIKGLSLKVAVSNAIFGGGQTKSLIEEFQYPRLGPGMMWERFRDHIVAHGGAVHLQSRAKKIHHNNGIVTSVDCESLNKQVLSCKIKSGQVISSIPVTQLIQLLDPPPPAVVLTAARSLSYRSFLIVCLIVQKKDLFPDNWIYIHSPNVTVGRIQNFKNWSLAMVPDPGTSSIGMEYFCTLGDPLWHKSDNDLISQATDELEMLGLATKTDVIDGTIIRQPMAYPVYNESYEENLSIIKDFLGSLSNLQTIGRNGLHRYNNMDHSMQTGVQAARNTCGAEYDLWEVNEEASYLEESKEKKETSLFLDKILKLSFARIDPLAFACSWGTLAGLLIFIATNWLVIKGGENIGQHLQLLSQYFLGYTVTFPGSMIGFAFAFVTAFVLGWSTAYLRNLFLALFLYHVKKRNDLLTLKDFFDHL